MKRSTLTKKLAGGLWKVSLLKEDQWGKRLAGTWTNLSTIDAQAMVWNWEESGKMSSQWPGHSDGGVFMTTSYSVNLEERLNTCPHQGGKSFIPNGFICQDCSELIGSGEKYSDIEKMIEEVEELLNA